MHSNKIGVPIWGIPDLYLESILLLSSVCFCKWYSPVALLTAAHCINLYELWTNLRASALFSIFAAISLVDLKSSLNVIKHVAILQAFISPHKPKVVLLLSSPSFLAVVLWQPLGFIRSAVRWKSPHFLYSASHSSSVLLKAKGPLRDHVTDLEVWEGHKSNSMLEFETILDTAMVSEFEGAQQC